MSNLKAKVLGLAAVASVFAGLSYGQVVTCSGSTAPFGLAGAAAGQPDGVLQGSNPSLRVEGETELLADYIAVCSSTAATSGTLFITTSAPITSKTIPVSGAPAISEAVLQISTGGWLAFENNAVTGLPAASTAGTLVAIGAGPTPVTAISGTVTGSQVSFTIPAGAIPAGNFYIQVSNIRVNASVATAQQITETGLLSYAVGASAANATIANVPAGGTTVNSGIALQSLSYAPGTGALAAATNETSCSGNAGIPGAVAPGTSFTIVVTELEPGALKLSEAGSFQGVPNAAVGTAASATQIQIALANVPTSATVNVPTQIAIGAGGTQITTNGGTANVTGPLAGYSSFTPSATGTLTIVYAVTGVGTAGSPSFNIPVKVQYTANSFTPPVPALPTTYVVSYSPAATITGPATSIPTFAVSTATPTSGITFNGCSTTLLFPYVTNGNGYETGLAIANTTSDNLGKAGASVAVPTNGTCTLNFYGNQTQPAAYTLPNLLGAYTAAAPTVNPVWADTLSDVSKATNFTGYVIANCNFQEAHGFSFIVDASALGAGNGVSEGFPAIVIPTSRNENNGSPVSLSFTIAPPTGTATIGAAASISVSATGSVAGVTGQ